MISCCWYQYHWISVSILYHTMIPKPDFPSNNPMNSTSPSTELGHYVCLSIEMTCIPHSCHLATERANCTRLSRAEILSSGRILKLVLTLLIVWHSLLVKLSTFGSPFREDIFNKISKDRDKARVNVLTWLPLMTKLTLDIFFFS